MKIDHLPDNWRYEKRDRSYAIWDENGVQRCGVKCRNGARKGQPCRNHPEEGRLRCNMHPGEKRIGPDNPSYKTGENSRYWKQLPARLRSRYTESLESGDLANLSENIALLDLMLGEQLSRLDIGQFGASYNALRGLHYRMQREWQGALNQNASADERRESLNHFTDSFTQMGDLIANGQRDYVTLQNILSLNAERRQTVKTLVDIEHKGENAITVAEFMAAMLKIETEWRRINKLQDEEDRNKEMSGMIRLLVQGGE